MVLTTPSQELRQWRLILRDRPLADYVPLLQNVGQFLKKTVPRELENDYLLEVEELLNDVYNHSHYSRWPEKAREGTLHALSKAGSISDEIQPDQPTGRGRSPDLFRH